MSQAANHRYTQEQLDLGEALLVCAFRGSIPDLRRTYVAGGLAQNYAARADMLILLSVVPRVTLNWGWRRVLRIRRSSRDRDLVLETVLDGAPPSVIDPIAAAGLVEFACKLADRLPDFQVDDLTCQTYVAVSAGALMYTVGPNPVAWKKRYRAIARIMRRRFAVRSTVRMPPGGW